VAKNLRDQTGVQTIENEDYRKYIDDAIKEINQLKSKPKKDT